MIRLDRGGPFPAMMPRMDPVARDYDALAAEYARHLAEELTRKPMDRAWLAAFATRMAGQGLIVDLGCGPGHVTGFLAACGAEVMGLDLSAGMIREALAAHPGLRFEQGDFRSLDRSGRRYAGLLAMYSLIHLDAAALPAALAACRACLNPGGEFLAAVHLGEGVLHPGTLWEVPITLGFRLFAEGELERALEAAGFVVTESLVREPYPGVEYPSRRAYVTARAG